MAWGYAMTEPTDLDCLPSHFIEIDDGVMSNCDHEIDHAVAERLRTGPYYSGYPGWNFYGKVWFGEGKWRCEVWRYNSHVETIVADALEDIMREASEKYGSE